jgi:hypothetical protein
MGWKRNPSNPDILQGSTPTPCCPFITFSNSVTTSSLPYLPPSAPWGCRLVRNIRSLFHYLPIFTSSNHNWIMFLLYFLLAHSPHFQTHSLSLSTLSILSIISATFFHRIFNSDTALSVEDVLDTHTPTEENTLVLSNYSTLDLLDAQTAV